MVVRRKILFSCPKGGKCQNRVSGFLVNKNEELDAPVSAYTGGNTRVIIVKEHVVVTKHLVLVEAVREPQSVKLRHKRSW